MKAVFKIPHENRKGHICIYKIFLVCCYTGSSITLVGEKKNQHFEQNMIVQKKERKLGLEFSHLYS